MKAILPAVLFLAATTVLYTVPLAAEQAKMSDLTVRSVQFTHQSKVIAFIPGDKGQVYIDWEAAQSAASPASEADPTTRALARLILCARDGSQCEVSQ